MTFISKFISVVILLLSGYTQVFASASNASAQIEDKVVHTQNDVNVTADDFFASINKGFSDIHINDKTEITESEEQEEHLDFQHEDVNYKTFLATSLYFHLPKYNHIQGYQQLPLYHHSSTFFSHQVLYISFCVYRL